MKPVINTTRNSLSLTGEEIIKARNYALSLGATLEMIIFSEEMNTSYGNIFGQEILYIGTDVLPHPNPSQRKTPNSQISMYGAIAHELIGHRKAELAGRAFNRNTAEEIALDEAQASIRAARFAPDLTKIERYILLKDAITRLKKVNLKIRQVRHLLYIERAE